MCLHGEEKDKTPKETIPSCKGKIVFLTSNEKKKNQEKQEKRRLILRGARKVNDGVISSPPSNFHEIIYNIFVKIDNYRSITKAIDIKNVKKL